MLNLVITEGKKRMKQFEQQIDKTIDSLAHITTHF